ncbi:MAG TPA: hypothetical protein VGX52_14460 [Burkholderiales bacterium]|nr:hypothetical protein [Burkholderiales bacterium]
MTRDQRPLAAVPRWVVVLGAVALAAQITWQVLRDARIDRASDLPPSPGAPALRLASFGEVEALARLTMLYLQSYDYGGANSTPYQKLDYGRLVDWLGSILELDPRSQYPLFAAARVYAETPDPARSRIALEFVYEQFLRDPDRRWPWLAHAALLAKHRLNDLPLARRYARALERLTTARDVPLWAKQMEIFILEDMNELEAAKIMIGGLLESGTITDPAELRFLKQRLEELEKR